LLIKFLLKTSDEIDIIEQNLLKLHPNKRTTEDQNHVYVAVLLISVIVKLLCFWLSEFNRLLTNSLLMIVVFVPKSFWCHPYMIQIYKIPGQCFCILFELLVFCCTKLAYVCAVIIGISISIVEWLYGKLMVIQPQILCYISIILWFLGYTNYAFMAALMTVYKVERNHSLMITRVLCHLQPHMMVPRDMGFEHQLRSDRNSHALYTCLKMMEMTGKISEQRMNENLETVKSYVDVKNFVFRQLHLEPGDTLEENDLEARAKKWLQKSTSDELKRQVVLAEDIIMEQVDQMLNAQMSPRPTPTPPADHTKCQEKAKKIRTQLDEMTKEKNQLSRKLEEKVMSNREETKSYKDRIKELHVDIKSKRIEIDGKNDEIKRLKDDISRINGEKNKLKVQIDQRTKECKEKFKELKRNLKTMPAKDARITELERELRQLKNGGGDTGENDYTRPECSICTDYYSSSHQPISLKCGHVFGSVCITQWINKKGSCPTCSKTTSTNEFLTIYM